jgi:hypothetical protein
MDPSQGLYRRIKATSIITVILGIHSLYFILHILEYSYILNTQQLLSATSYVTALSHYCCNHLKFVFKNSSHNNEQKKISVLFHLLGVEIECVKTRLSQNRPHYSRGNCHTAINYNNSARNTPHTATLPITCPQLTFEANPATICEVAGYNMYVYMYVDAQKHSRT